ncbi:polyprenyl synthetase family protein [Macrococcus capreoli]|uniref:polyprenyl synthetase family protein n=1 Tax=Macrococcus capreoli TaxID=2982690 RepID=UPI003EE70B4A
MNNVYLDRINNNINALYQDEAVSPHLAESIRYSLQAGGKRIRPLLLMTTIESLGGNPELGMPFGLALEMIHTYSLIHDDLPAMDNDDYRRGKLTNHKVFGEATAILAGDALLTDSFQLILKSDYTDVIKIKLMSLLTKAAGSHGMVAGQMLDMASENKKITLEQLETIHHHKTGDLIHAAIYAAGIIVSVEENTLTLLDNIGRNIGLMFQIKDDILDVEGEFEKIGKAVGSDIQNDKSTYVSLLGLEASKQKLETIYNDTIELIERVAINKAPFNELLQFIVHRDK